MLTRPAPEPDVVASYGPGDLDVADVQLGGDDQPLVLVLHGGFWRPEYDRTHLHAMIHALAAEGFAAAAPEYRRIPGDPSAALEDVRVALRILPVELRGRHDGRVIVAGHSAGGHLALWAASVAPPPGAIGTLALAPVADVAGADRERLGDGAVEAFLGAAAAARTDLDPTRMVSAIEPVLLLHGVEDDVVPVRSPRPTPLPTATPSSGGCRARGTSTSSTRPPRRGPTSCVPCVTSRRAAVAGTLRSP